MGFLDALKRRINASAVPGYGGGNLQDQLEWDRHSKGVALNQNPSLVRGVAPTEDPDRMPFPGSPEHELAMSRAVPVRAGEIPQPANTIAPPDATRQRAVSFDPATGKPNDDFYRANPDPVEGAMGRYDAYQKWEPRGGKRGFKNALKTGAMYAAEAVRNNPQDPLAAAIAGFGTGAIGGTAQPNFRNRLTRQWKLGQAGGELKNQLDLQKQKATIDSLGEVPVEMPDGSTVMVPRKTAGSVAIRSMGEGRQRDTAKARIDNWKSMRAEQRKARIVREYTQGMLNDPDSLEYAADELSIPGNLREKFINGQMRKDINDKGEIILIDQQTGAVKNTGAKSFENTKEGGRNKRSAAQIAAADRRTFAENARFYAGLDQRAASELRARHDKAADVAGDYRTYVGLVNSTDPNSEDHQLYDSKARGLRKQLEATGLYEFDDDGNAIPKSTPDIGAQVEQGAAPQRPVDTGLMPDKGKFDRDKYVQTYRRMHKGKQPTQEQIESAEVLWTNP